MLQYSIVEIQWKPIQPNRAVRSADHNEANQRGENPAIPIEPSQHSDILATDVLAKIPFPRTYGVMPDFNLDDIAEAYYKHYGANIEGNSIRSFAKDHQIRTTSFPSLRNKIATHITRESLLNENVKTVA